MWTALPTRPPGPLARRAYRISRRLARVQIIKHRQGRWVMDTTIRYTHVSHMRVHEALDQLGYLNPNTSAPERRNGTARP